MNLISLLLASYATYATLAGAQSLPKLNIGISPLFKDTALTFLNFTLQIQDARSKANSTLVSFPINRPLSPSQRYDGDGLLAFDGKGALPLISTDVNGKRTWSLSRDPSGKINVYFLAEPRGDIEGVVGRSDLRFDQGGALGAGYSFIPYPPGDDQWEMTVEWDLSEAPSSGARFASSFGDVPKASATGVPNQVLDSAHFAVGSNLQRWPAWSEEQSGKKQFAMYWMGDLPWDSTSLASRTKKIYNGTANYFSDFESDFRVFYRRDFASFGGVGGWRSFLMEYRVDSAEENPEDSLLNLVSHEIIHGFAKLNPGDDYDKWYTEGIAEYLLSVAPYMGGSLDRKTFIQWLNDNAQDYYTASPLTRTWDTLITNYWTQGTMVVKAPYTRGFMYLAYVQGLIAKATDNKKSIDDLILGLYKMYNDGKQVRTQEFLSLLGSYIGSSAAQESFNAMSNGTVLIPDTDGFAHYGLKMVRKDRLKFSSGLSETSFGSGQVIGLVAGSRAQLAGLKEGEEIVSSWGLWGACDTYESKLQVVVKRDGKEVPVMWWPRQNSTTEAWEWVEAK